MQVQFNETLQHQAIMVMWPTKEWQKETLLAIFGCSDTERRELGT